MTKQTELLSADQMQQVDRTAAISGINTFELMENAGRSVAEQVLKYEHAVSPLIVVVGGGNNGGDGYIAAELLRKTGIATTVLRVGSMPIAGSDADKAKQGYGGNLLSLASDTTQIPNKIRSTLIECKMIIDALFGAGLRREVTGVVASLIETINQLDCPIISVDLPSGLDGNDNIVKGAAVQATQTVTFFLAKPAHYLFPGRKLCGELIVKQIGLNEAHLSSISAPVVHRNAPKLFTIHLPMPNEKAHKYQRGHVLVRSGPINSTGASRLSAGTALTCGAGAVTLASSDQALAVNAAHLTAVMLALCNNLADWLALLRNKNTNVAVIGPGNGIDEQIKDCVLESLKHPASLVLDADALSCWEDSPERFICALQNAKAPVVLTPHSAEFDRVFRSTKIVDLPSKLHQAQAAAKLTKAVVIYKGADTVIASPDGQACINCNAPPWLATAGSGDVLAGAVASLHAQGMPLFESAMAAVWLHGEAATALGYPLTAEQLLLQMGVELSRIHAHSDS